MKMSVRNVLTNWKDMKTKRYSNFARFSTTPVQGHGNPWATCAANVEGDIG